MRTLTRLLVVGASVATLAVWSLAGDAAARAEAGEAGVPQPALDAIIKQSIQNIQKALKKPKAKATAPAVRSNAFLITAAAQAALAGGNGNAAQLATLRDAALGLAKAAEGKTVNTNQAQKAVSVLARWPAILSDPQAGTKPVDLKAKFELDDVMTMFKKGDKVRGAGNKGGQGIEVELLTLGQVRRPYTPQQMKSFEPSAYKIALISPIVREYKDEKGWKDLTDEMQKLSLETVQAARARHPDEFKAALGKLTSNCTACHDKYRRKEE
jgi:hypothetical protein